MGRVCLVLVDEVNGDVFGSEWNVVLYSAGTDGIVKAAATATGQVTAKIAIPLNP